jgi:hypothetical protein
LHVADYRFRILLVALIALLLGYPYVDPEPGPGLFRLMSEIVFLTAVYATADTSVKRVIGFALAAVVLVTDWAPASSGPYVVRIGLAAKAAFFPFATVVIALQVFRVGKTTVDSIAGAVCVYFMVALTFASQYMLIETLYAGSFRLPEQEAADWSAMIHFSFTALTTVGYGDITPVSPQVRSLAGLESATGVLYTAILVARLVGSYMSAGGKSSSG